VWISVREFAERLNLSRGTVYRAVRDVDFPCPVSIIGDTIRIDVSQLMAGDWVTVAEFADVYNVSKSTIYRLLKQGKLGVRIGGAYRILDNVITQEELPE